MYSAAIYHIISKGPSLHIFKKYFYEFRPTSPNISYKGRDDVYILTESVNCGLTDVEICRQ